MMAQGIDLMLVGMGTVFAFLALLAFAMEFAGRFLSSAFPDAEVSTSQSVLAVEGAGEAEIALVIAAAHRFREGGGQ